MSDKRKLSILGEWKKRQVAANLTPSISKAPVNSPIPPSYGQKRLWFLQQLFPDNPFYNYTESLRFTGDLREGYLIESLQEIFDAHPIFQTCFGISDGELIQSHDQDCEIQIATYDISNLDEGAKEEELYHHLRKLSATSFDLNTPPLVSAALIKCDKDWYVLLITMHHIITDAWSMDLFKKELCKQYSNKVSGQPSTLVKPELNYADFAHWEQSKPINRAHLEYWRKYLSGRIPVLMLPTDYKRPAIPTYRGAQYRQTFSKDESAKILTYCRELKVTPYTFLLAAFYVLLYRHTNEKDILIGTPVSNRNEKALEDMFGFFNDIMVIRANLGADISFSEVLERVLESYLGAFSNREVPFDIIVKELHLDRSLGVNPLFQIMFLYQQVTYKKTWSDDLQLISDNPDTGVSKFDLTLFVFEDDGLISTIYEYSTDIFKEATIQRYQEHYKNIIREVISNSTVLIGKIPLLSTGERDYLLTRQHVGQDPIHRFKAIHHYFEHCVAQNPERPAIVSGQAKLTYKQLDTIANKLAAEILAHTFGKTNIVGLCLEQGAELIFAILGILKAGCAYLPMDPEHPRDRLQFMLTDSGSNLVLTNQKLVRKGKFLSIKTLVLEEIISSKASKVIEFPQINPTSLAYIIYTSGSTGVPKGVPITHGNIIHSTEARIEYYPTNPENFLLMSPITFDSSKAGVFWTLSTGGTLTIPPRRIEQDMAALEDLIKTGNISHTLLLPSLYHTILNHVNIEMLRSLTTVIVAGEACLSALCHLHFDKLPSVKLYNEYGPTEATVWCIAHEIKPNDIKGPIPIGKAVPGYKAYLLNEQQDLVPLGAIGEIYIGGAGLAGTYLSRPELSENSYYENPYEVKGTSKLYRTGDLGRYNQNGDMLFMGRSDQQVKVRGFRIEIEEIENVIKGYSSVNVAVVLVSEEENSRRLNPNGFRNITELVNYVSHHLSESETERLISTLELLDNHKQALR